MKGSNRRRQSGYALIATIGALTVMLIVLSGTMSTVAHELKREREAEMLFRGHQIVAAIARYQALARRTVSRDRRGQGRAIAASIWPPSLEQLVEGITLPPNRRVRLLRPSASRDPMTSSGAWRPVSYGDPALEDFLEAYFEYIGRTMPPIVRVKYLGQTIDFGEDDEDGDEDETEPRRRLSRALSRTLSQGNTRLSQAGESDDGQTNFIFGVVSQSEGKAVRDYFGLERYNQWAFVYVPELPMVMGEESIQMLSREILFPSDPLMWRTGRYARGRVVVPSRGQRGGLNREGGRRGVERRNPPDRGRGGRPGREARP